MQISSKKKSTNIAEYVIYMFQIENLIRSNKLDLETIVKGILQPQIADEEVLEQYKNWYAGLIKTMKAEGVEENGHLSEVDEILMELLMLHDTIMNVIKDPQYLLVFEKALPNLKAFQSKSSNGGINIIEVGFNALYSKIILKLKKESISSSTEEAFESISKLYAYLAAYYQKMKKGELNFINN